MRSRVGRLSLARRSKNHSSFRERRSRLPSRLLTTLFCVLRIQMSFMSKKMCNKNKSMQIVPSRIGQSRWPTSCLSNYGVLLRGKWQVARQARNNKQAINRCAFRGSRSFMRSSNSLFPLLASNSNAVREQKQKLTNRQHDFASPHLS